jgi:hypothetical protein
MKCTMGELKLWSHNANYCLIEVVTKAGNLQDITKYNIANSSCHFRSWTICYIMPYILYNYFFKFIFHFNFPYLLISQTCFNIPVYYEFSLLHIFSLVLQPWMSAYIRKTDGVYISVPKKRLKHGRQNITLHWINGIIRNNKCIITKFKEAKRYHFKFNDG